MERVSHLKITNRRLTAILILAFASAVIAYAKGIKVNSFAQFNKEIQALMPGDSLVLANGVWKDVQLVFKGKGERGKYIYLTAETPGKVTIEGESNLQISGDWLHISGLVFVNGYTPGKTVIEFRTSSKDYAYNSVLTNCVIDRFNQMSKGIADHWIGLWGKGNTVEFCYFGGKSNEGTTLVIWPDDINSINNGHLIYRNYFGFRPSLGSNGGESIRIGTSEVCSNSSGSVVEGNYFERCNGEAELISNKSGDNKFINNTFFECEGSLVLRHGNNGIVAGNWFIGNGKRLTGGVRVINEGHRIYNNFFYKLRGEEYRSALGIMNAIPDSPPSGYAPVKNVIVANNTYADCSTPWSFCLGANDRNRTIKPEKTLIINNLVVCTNESELIASYDMTDGIILENNVMIYQNGFYDVEGSVSGKISIARLWGMDIPFTNVNGKKLPFIKSDILGNSLATAVIGAFQKNKKEPKVTMATSENCGPSWYKPLLTAQMH